MIYGSTIDLDVMIGMDATQKWEKKLSFLIARLSSCKGFYSHSQR